MSIFQIHDSPRFFFDVLLLLVQRFSTNFFHSKFLHETLNTRSTKFCGESNVITIPRTTLMSGHEACDDDDHMHDVDGSGTAETGAEHRGDYISAPRYRFPESPVSLWAMEIQFQPHSRTISIGTGQTLESNGLNDATCRKRSRQQLAPGLEDTQEPSQLSAQHPNGGDAPPVPLDGSWASKRRRVMNFIRGGSVHEQNLIQQKSDDTDLEEKQGGGDTGGSSPPAPAKLSQPLRDLCLHFSVGVGCF